MGLDEFTAPVQLGAHDTFDEFCSGVDVVDDWVHTHAAHAKQRGTAVVYITHPVVDAVPRQEVVGFYSLSTFSVKRESVASGWLKRNMPQDILVILLGMLGVHSAYQDKGLGAALLSDALKRSLVVADSAGAKALLVEPYDQDAQAFYERHGFAPVPGTTYLFIPLKL